MNPPHVKNDSVPPAPRHGDPLTDAARLAALYGTLKRCSRCLLHRPLAAFARQIIAGRLYLRAECLECGRVATRERMRRLLAWRRGEGRAAR